MRSDFILPTLLALALAVMIAYAATAMGRSETVAANTPATCEHGSILTTISELREASALAASRRTPQLFWSLNDSSSPVVVAIDTRGRVRGRVRIPRASVVDWEALTAAECGDGPCLFIGDIGDNDRVRGHITIYRVKEPAPSDEVAAAATAFEAVYPEGPQDAEALFVADGTLYIVTKGHDMPVRLYRLPTLERPDRQTLHLVTTLTAGPATSPARITDAALSPDGRRVALRSNDALLFYDTRTLLSGSPGTPLSFDARGIKEPQGEGIAWGDDHTLFLTGEGPHGGTFARVTCSF
jgi:hypothetical protein